MKTKVSFIIDYPINENLDHSHKKGVIIEKIMDIFFETNVNIIEKMIDLECDKNLSKEFKDSCKTLYEKDKLIIEDIIKSIEFKFE